MSEQKQRLRRNGIVIPCLLEVSEDAKLTGKKNFFFLFRKGAVPSGQQERRERETLKWLQRARLCGLRTGVNPQASHFLHFL